VTTISPSDSAIMRRVKSGTVMTRSAPAVIVCVAVSRPSICASTT
jgi:hypothetical protein